MSMNGIEAPVRRRIQWALEENRHAQRKLLTLLVGLNIDQALWKEITCHMADTQSHLTNVLGYLPEQGGKQKG